MIFLVLKKLKLIIQYFFNYFPLLFRFNLFSNLYLYNNNKLNSLSHVKKTNLSF